MFAVDADQLSKFLETAGQHGVLIGQLAPQQGRAAAVHEPASRREVPGHLHLDRRHRRGAPQQDQDSGHGAAEHRW